MVLAIIPYLQDRSIGDRIKPFDAVASAVPDGWTTRIETFLSFFLFHFVSFFLPLALWLPLFVPKKKKRNKKRQQKMPLGNDPLWPWGAVGNRNRLRTIGNKKKKPKKNKQNKTKTERRNWNAPRPRGRRVSHCSRRRGTKSICILIEFHWSAPTNVGRHCRFTRTRRSSIADSCPLIRAAVLS